MKHSGSRPMKETLFRCAWLFFCVAVLAGCARIKPDEIGVLTSNVGQGEGIVPQDFEPGYHRFLWPMHTWHRFPSTVQRIRFAKDSQGAWAAESPALQITSADGDRVVVNAEVFFRVAKGGAHRLLQDSGPGERYKEVVRGMAQDATRVLFGRLKTEAFYNPEQRELVRQQAVTELRERLRFRNIDLIDILVDSIEFDTNYETLIKQKKLADQRVELEKAKGKAAEETAKVAKIEAEGAVKLQKLERETDIQIGTKTLELNLKIGALRAEAEKHAAQLRADADLYRNQRDADGQRLVRAADAEGSKRLNEALIGEGGRNVVALEAVKKLNLAEVTFPSPDYGWFNPHEMALQLGAAGEPIVYTNALLKK